MAVAALILEFVEFYDLWPGETATYWKHSLFNFIYPLLNLTICQTAEVCLEELWGNVRTCDCLGISQCFMGCSSCWLRGLQLEPFVAFPAFYSCSGELGTDDTQLLVFNQIWSLQPPFWRGLKEFKDWVSLNILWRTIARIEVPPPRSAALSHSKFLPRFWSLATFSKQQSSNCWFFGPSGILLIRKPIGALISMKLKRLPEN